MFTQGQAAVRFWSVGARGDHRFHSNLGKNGIWKKKVQGDHTSQALGRSFIGITMFVHPRATSHLSVGRPFPQRPSEATSSPTSLERTAHHMRNQISSVFKATLQAGHNEADMRPKRILILRQRRQQSAERGICRADVPGIIVTIVSRNLHWP
jgi:hypothetical protein